MTDKQKPGFPTRFKDKDFLNVLTDKPQTTTQIKKAVGSSRDTAARALKRLATEGIKVNDDAVFPVEMIEIEAGTGTGKMYLWKITEAGIKARDTEKENST